MDQVKDFVNSVENNDMERAAAVYAKIHERPVDIGTLYLGDRLSLLEAGYDITWRTVLIDLRENIVSGNYNNVKQIAKAVPKNKTLRVLMSIDTSMLQLLDENRIKYKFVFFDNDHRSTTEEIKNIVANHKKYKVPIYVGILDRNLRSYLELLGIPYYVGIKSGFKHDECVEEEIYDMMDETSKRELFRSAIKFNLTKSLLVLTDRSYIPNNNDINEIMKSDDIEKIFRLYKYLVNVGITFDKTIIFRSNFAGDIIEGETDFTYYTDRCFDAIYRESTKEFIIKIVNSILVQHLVKLGLTEKLPSISEVIWRQDVFLLELLAEHKEVNEEDIESLITWSEKICLLSVFIKVQQKRDLGEYVDRCDQIDMIVNRPSIMIKRVL